MKILTASFYNYFLFLVIFLCSFSGNAILGRVDLFFLLSIFLACILCFGLYFRGLFFRLNAFNFSMPTLSSIVFIQLLLFFILIKSFFIGVPYIDYYYWVIKCEILILFLFLIKALWREKSSGFDVFFYGLVFFSFICLLFFFGEREGGRMSFVFGPNVLYRVLIFLSLVFVFYLAKSTFFLKNAFLCFIFFVLIYFLSIIGSRGGGLSC